jgi:hypothetical protein
MKALLRIGPALGVALVLGVGAFAVRPAPAAPVQIAPALSAPELIRIAGCREGCEDCDDCPTEIDIAPPPRHRDDPIAREIERFGGPAPLSHPCETRRIVTRGRRATLDADSCGIRCWYWRLRHGYCGPGCEYYRYRMYHYGQDHHPRSAC